jgi:Flp pilus assembly protein TadD
VARNSLTAHAITCTACGATFKASHNRCPRCRTWVAIVDPAAIEASSRRFKRVAVYVTGLALAGFIGVWLLAPAAASSAVVRAVPAKKPIVPPAARPKIATERPFMDASGKAYESYQAGDFNGALKNYQDAVARNPTDPEALSNLGQVLVRLERPQEALPYFNKAIALNSDRWAYVFNRARAQGLLGHWTECIADYRRAQQLFPNDYATTYNLALALHKSGDEEAAIVEYRKAIDLAPDDGVFRRALAMSLERLDRRAEAASAYEEYLKLTPNAADADAVRERITRLTSPEK